MFTSVTGHKPENLAMGAVLTTLSFFCVGRRSRQSCSHLTSGSAFLPS
jgi:hypothetical protein